MSHQPDNISAGTQVVSLVGVRGTGDLLVHPRGAVGVVTRTPDGPGERHFLVRFSDGFEGSLTRQQFDVLCNEGLLRLQKMIDETSQGPRFSRYRKVLIFSVAGLIALALCIGLAVLHFRAEKRRAWAEIRAKLQISRVALEIERWRLVHDGCAPDSLAELAPDFSPSIPLDPFDNNPLRYKKMARGFLVYSIGADFSDDGGKEKTGDEADSDHYDITFRVER
jgi:hypothetical protein